MKSADTQLTPHPGAAAQARAFVASQLSAWNVGRCREEALLATSELVTNAVVHGEGPITVKVAEDARCVRLEVQDTGARVPAIRPSAGAQGGYGLRLVEGVCAKWGVSRLEEGKVVWCECEHR